jgi:preprotein translocase subunit SecG
MLAVLLTVHLIACLALVIAVLLQRSEGGALGMGGGGTGGLISGRGAAGALVKVTMGLAAVFFTTSVLMTRLNAEDAAAPTDLEQQNRQQNSDPFNSLGIPSTTTPGTTTTPDAPPASTPAPATPDPLAPATPPSGSTTPPASTTAPPASTAPAQPAPSQPAPAAPDPLRPTPPAGGTPNQ